MTENLASLESAIRDFRETQDIPGIVAGVVDLDRSIVRSSGVAQIASGRPITERTIFRIASMTKSFTALAVLQLRDDGILRLDDAVSTYVPEIVRIDNRTSDSAPVTLRHLLSHLAGFVSDDAWADRQLAMTDSRFARLLRTELAAAMPPGLRFEYANIGYAILGLVVSRLSGARFQEFVETRLLAPLGMTATSFDPTARTGDVAVGYRSIDGCWSEERVEGDGAFAAIGGITTNAGDFARYTGFLLDAWPPRDDADDGPIRRATVRELGVGWGPPVLEEWQGRDGVPVITANVYGQGMMCSVDASLGRYLQHSGGLPGYGSNVLLFPDSGRAVFAFGNRTYAPMVKLTRSIAALVNVEAAKGRQLPNAATLAAVCAAVERAYDQQRIESMNVAFADNFFADRSAAERSKEIAAIHRRFGARRNVRIEMRHQHAAALTFTCESGTLIAEVGLAPLAAPSLQYLEWTQDGAHLRRTSKTHR